MVDVAEEKSCYLSHFERIERESEGRGQEWLLRLRKAAMARFVELGFPTTRHEEWRHTNVAPLADTAFEYADGVATDGPIERIDPLALTEGMGAILVFVNGRYAPALSRSRELPAGVKIGSLAAAMEEDRERIELHLARHARYQDQAFTALNTALMEDGAFVYVPRGTVLEAPIHFVFVATARGQAIALHPRNLIIAEANSQATILETYVGSNDESYFTNTVTEVVAGGNAIIDHYKIERESDRAFHVGTLQLHQDRQSSVSSHAMSFGGKLVRNDINAVLDGEGGQCALSGLYVVEGSQHVDNHLVVEHAKPRCDSREFFKGILDGKARGVFSGRIIVREGAQKTDAKQTNMSLLLSPDAQVESRPQLEILADDVKCTHGATIGQISDDAIFYLRSRGITEEAARNVLVYAFARESLGRIRVEPLRRQIEQWLVERIADRRLIQEGL